VDAGDIRGVQLECEFMLGNAIDERSCYQVSIKSLLIRHEEGVFGYQPAVDSGESIIDSG